MTLLTDSTTFLQKDLMGNIENGGIHLLRPVDVLLNLTGNKYYELGSKLNLQQLADFL
jgi:hypothetical protein